VVEEEAVLVHGSVEGLLAGMAEWRMANVMHQGEGLNQIDIKTQLSSDGSGDLCDLDGMGKTIAKMVGVTAGEDLGFGFEAAKSPGVDDAIAVALKVVAVRMLRLGITASAGLLHPHRVVGEHQESLTEAAVSIWQPS